MTALPSPQPTTPRWPAGLLIMCTLLVAAGATFWGSFLNIQSYKRVFSSNVLFDYDTSWWKLTDRGTGAGLPDSWFPPYGAIPAVAGGLLVFSAILALTAFAGRRPGMVTAIRVASSVGVGLLGGAVMIRLLDGLSTLDQINKEDVGPGQSIEFRFGLGLYVPAAAAAVGLVGLLLTLNRGRAARVEPDTPRIGFPMPYQPPPSQPFPVQQPVSQPFPAQPAPPAPHPAGEPGQTAPQ
jgi:hypothetical protein